MQPLFFLLFLLFIYANLYVIIFNKKLKTFGYYKKMSYICTDIIKQILYL